MHNGELLRNLGLTAAAIVATFAIACSTGSDSDDTPSTAGSEGAAVAPSGQLRAGLDKPLADTDGAGTSQADDFAGEESARNAVAPSAAGNQGAGVGTTSPGGTLASAADRKIISTASIEMQVENVGGGFQEVGRIATASGGFVASSSFSNQGEDQIASVTIRVPSAAYQDVLADLRELGVKVNRESSETSDVTEEYTDLGSRLRTLEATEAQMLTLLGQAESINDILTVQDRLNYTRGEIEQVKGRMQLLDNLGELATITVHLGPVVAGATTDPKGEPDGVRAQVSETWDESLAFLEDIAEVAVTVIVFLWWIPIAGVPVLIGYKAVTRQRPQAAHVSEPAD